MFKVFFMLFADPVLYLVPCLIDPDQWRQVFPDQMPSEFFSRLDIGGWFWAWHHNRGDQFISFIF